MPTEHGTFVTIERKDGTALSGLLGSATADDRERRDLLLIAPQNRPIYARTAKGADPVRLDEAFVIVRGEDVDLITGKYLPVASEPAPGRSRFRPLRMARPRR